MYRTLAAWFDSMPDSLPRFMVAMACLWVWSAPLALAAAPVDHAAAEMERAETWHQLGRATGNDKVAFEHAFLHYGKAVSALGDPTDARSVTLQSAARVGAAQAEASMNNAHDTFRNVVRDAWWVSGIDETVELYDDTWMRALGNAWTAERDSLDRNVLFGYAPVVVRVDVASQTAALGDNIEDEVPVEVRTELVRDELLGLVTQSPSLYGIRPAQGRAKVGAAWDAVTMPGAPVAPHLDALFSGLGFQSILVVDATVPDTFVQDLPVGQLDVVRVKLDAQLWNVGATEPVFRANSVGMARGVQGRSHLFWCWAFTGALLAGLLGALAFRAHVRLESVPSSAQNPRVIGALGVAAFLVSMALSSTIGGLTSDYLIEWDTPMFVAELGGFGIPYLPTLVWPLVYGLLVMVAPLVLVTYVTLQVANRLGEFDGGVQPDLVVAAVGPAAQLGATVQVFDPLVLAEPGAWWRVAAPWALLTGISAWMGAQALAEVLPPRPLPPEQPSKRLATAIGVAVLMPPFALIDGWAIPVCVLGAAICMVAHVCWKSVADPRADAEPVEDTAPEPVAAPVRLSVHPPHSLLPVAHLADHLQTHGCVVLQTRRSSNEIRGTLKDLLDVVGGPAITLVGDADSQTSFGALTAALRPFLGAEVNLEEDARRLDEVTRLGRHLQGMISGFNPLAGLVGDEDDADEAGFDRSAFVATAANRLRHTMLENGIRQLVVLDHQALDAGSREVCARLASMPKAAELNWIVHRVVPNAAQEQVHALPDGWNQAAFDVAKMTHADLGELCAANRLAPLDRSFSNLILDAADHRLDTAQDLLRELAREGNLVEQDGIFVLDEAQRADAEERLARGAHRLFEARLEALDPMSLTILHCAAASGSEVTIAEVLAGVGCSRSVARAGLDQLTSDPDYPWLAVRGEAYTFCSELARRALRDGVGLGEPVLWRTERHSIHHHVASANAGPAAVLAERRWFHARAGRLLDQPLGVRSLLDFTSDMMRRVGWREVLELLRQPDARAALRTAPDEQKGVLYKRGLVAAMRLEQKADQEWFQDALVPMLQRRLELGLACDGVWPRIFLDWCESLYLYAGRDHGRELAASHLEPMARACDDPLLCAVLAFYQEMMDRTADHEAVLRRLEAQVDTLPRSPVRLHLQSRIMTAWANAVINSGLGELDAAFFQRLAEARRLKELLNDADGKGLCWNLTGRAHEALGAWDAALDGMKQNLEVCRAAGLDHRRSKAHNDVARVLCKRNAPGDLAQALEASNAAREFALRLDPTLNLAFALHQRLVLWAASSDDEELPPGPEWSAAERDLVWPVVQEKDFLQKMMRTVLQTLVEAERTAPWMVEWLEALAVPEAAKAGAESAPAGAETVEPSGPSEEPEESTEA